MLNPTRQPIVLLPQDREVMATLGLTEAEYRTFVRECLNRSKVDPAKPVNFLIIPFLIQLAIGIALSYAASLLFRPKQLEAAKGGIRQKNKQGQNIINRTEFAPKAGFDSLQNVVELGSTIPLVYTKRETIDGVTYGGVRVNTNLLWSQMQSLGGGQLLRAVFLISEATLGQVDPAQFAFGDNVLGAYDLSTANDTSSRLTFYVSRNGGRLVSTDRVAGRSAANDEANAANYGGVDVFQVRGANNSWSNDFCYSFKPSTQTQFGLHSFVGNGFGYRVNPVFRPRFSVRTKPDGKEGDFIVQCTRDVVADAQRKKYREKFACRGGVIAKDGVTISGQQSFAIGNTITYFLDKSSDAKTEFLGETYGSQQGATHREKCNDVAQAVASRQRSWDDALTKGELFKFGSALFVVELRSPENSIFSSEIDQQPVGGGQSITVTLRCVKAGTAVLRPTSDTRSATYSPHLMKIAVAAFAMPRAAQIVELGFRSTLGIRISGLCNFRDTKSQENIDNNACLQWENDKFDRDQIVPTSNYTSGTYTGTETRYSFFKIGYRIAGSSAAFTYLQQCFGVRSVTQQASYNYLRLQMASVQRWEFRLEPVSGWEIRNNIDGVANGSLEILDSSLASFVTSVSGDVTAYFNGESVARNQATFRMPATAERDIGFNTMDEDDYADAWGRLAEEFVYQEITASTQQPEHELVYVNVITPNQNTPNYDDMALVGVNIRSSNEFSQLSQLSVYINEGIANGVHTFPEVLKDLLTNSRYGVGSILSSQQIDDAGFAECATWTRGRKYFFDGAIDEGINLRQWASVTSGYYLLDLVIRNGKFSLQPAVYFDRPEPITSLYTVGNIIEDSFEFVYSDIEQRIPIRVSVKWRQEKAATDGSSRGLFPVIREITVREKGNINTPADAPLESIDLTDFCTSENHAIDVAKFICRGRRLTTHSIRFKTTPTEAALEIGRCFKLGLETTSYQQPNNGAIDSNGNITSVEPLADGSYTVLIWDGRSNVIEEEQLIISGGRSTNKVSAVFCIKQSLVETKTYKAQSIGFDEDGNLDVEASYFPLDANGYSEIVSGWDVSDNWEIEGQIGTSENNVTPNIPFTGAQVVGPTSITAGVPETYSALVSGGTGAYSYLWTGSGLTIATPTAATTTVTAAAGGTYTLSCAVSLGGNTNTGSKVITVEPAAAAITIGTVTITGSSSVASGSLNFYSASWTNKAAPVAAGSFVVGQVYQIVSAGTTNFTLIGATVNTAGTVFTATGAGTGTGTADSITDTETSVTWTWTSSSPGASAIIQNAGTPLLTATFNYAGTYVLTATVNSFSATDNPRTASITVTVTGGDYNNAFLG